MHTVHYVVYLPWPSRTFYPWLESSVEQSLSSMGTPFFISPFFVNHMIEVTKDIYKYSGKLHSVSKNQGRNGRQGSGNGNGGALVKSLPLMHTCLLKI